MLCYYLYRYYVIDIMCSPRMNRLLFGRSSSGRAAPFRDRAHNHGAIVTYVCMCIYIYIYTN